MVVTNGRTVKREKEEDTLWAAYLSTFLRIKPRINYSFLRINWMDTSGFSPRLFPVLWASRASEEQFKPRYAIKGGGEGGGAVLASLCS